MVICICTCVGSNIAHITTIGKWFNDSYTLLALFGNDEDKQLRATEIDDKCVIKCTKKLTPTICRNF